MYTTIVRKLNITQREIVTDYCRKVALVATTTLLISQFVPGEPFDMRIVVLGALLSILLLAFAVLLNRKYES